jgi:signal transduction histidine kinase
MKEGGILCVETRRSAEGWVEVSIADTGPGVPAAVREHIFEPFFSTKGEGEGTGLGLYICRNIAAEHGGRLFLETEEGKGTAFRLLLPTHPPGLTEEESGNISGV